MGKISYTLEYETIDKITLQENIDFKIDHDGDVLDIMITDSKGNVCFPSYELLEYIVKQAKRYNSTTEVESENVCIVCDGTGCLDDAFSTMCQSCNGSGKQEGGD